MDNQQPASEITPQATVVDAALNEKRSKRRLYTAILCMAGPSLLIVACLLSYALVSFISSGFGQPNYADGLYNAPSVIDSIINAILFLIGALAFLSLVPGLIVGIVLLATKPK